MTNIATTTATVTPLLSKSLGSRELAEHRAMVAFELEVLAKHVDRFGWDRDRGTPAHDRMMKDWMEVLQDYPIQEIHDACIAAITARPNSIPNYGHVKAQIMAARQKVAAAQPKPRPEPKPYTPPSNAQKAAANDMAREFARRAGSIK